MDLKKTAKEIGLFETAINLSKVYGSKVVADKVGTSMPMPGGDVKNRIEQIADWLLSFKKDKYMFLTPEIALIEEIKKRTSRAIEAIIAIPCNMESDVIERLQDNLPHGITVTILEEPFFPKDFFPGNSMLVICGYAAGERAMIMPDTYRLLEHYSSFLGKKVFVPYVELKSSTRYDDWMEVNQQKLSIKWRAES